MKGNSVIILNTQVTHNIRISPNIKEARSNN